MHPFDREIRDFFEFMRSAQELSAATVLGYSSRAGILLMWLGPREAALWNALARDQANSVVRTAGWTPLTFLERFLGFVKFLSVAFQFR